MRNLKLYISTQVKACSSSFSQHPRHRIEEKA